MEEKVKQTELSPLKLCHAASGLKHTLRGGDTSQRSHEPNQTAEGGGEERAAG